MPTKAVSTTQYIWCCMSALVRSKTCYYRCWYIRRLLREITHRDESDSFVWYFYVLSCVTFDIISSIRILFMSQNIAPHKFHLSLGVIGLIFIITFTLQNYEVVSLNLLFWKFELSRVILILIVLLIGFLLGYIFRAMQRKTH